ncbi:MAG: FAD-dependent oxidoreductase [Phycisphaerae bacterium]|nr:FAD-dependent oxidoreductase [Phycisphaerae bacterium]
MTNRIDRRRFIQTGAAAAGGMSLAAGTGRAEMTSNGKAWHEAARNVPIVEDADVVVCGGGPAGIAAAIAAARCGARTRLIEVNGCLGGMWTAGLLSWILDSDNKSGIMREILQRLEKHNAVARYGGSVGYDVEAMKLLLETMCVEAGVHVRLHTRIVAAGVHEGRLAIAVTESKSGRQAWRAKVFVDCTGDGDLAALAGCTFAEGRPGTGAVQPMSMMALLTGLVPAEVARFVRGLAEPLGENNPKARLLEEMQRAGVAPSYTQPTLFCIKDDLFCLATNHQYGVKANDAEGTTRATLCARAEIHTLVDALVRLGGCWKNMHIIATPEHIGVREARRIRGLYEVSADDLINGARHADAVCRVTFPVDVHSTDPTKDKGITREGVRARPYDIPYRSLIPVDVKGLLLAGRCISGDFVAHSSYRVTGNAAPMGEAAGTAAAMAAQSNRAPEHVPWDEISEAMKKHNSML